MFWKSTDSKVEVTLDLEDKRENFRLQPDPPIRIYFDNQSAEIVDISAGGVAFNSSDLNPGMVVEAEIEFDAKKLACRIGVIEASDTNLCRCHFIDLDKEDADRLHRYVIQGQKALIRKQR